MAAIECPGDLVAYETRRVQDDAPPAELAIQYRPTGPKFEAKRGSLEHWLTERYCLYTFDDRLEVLRGEIQHPPWQLQTAAADLHVNTMLDEVELKVGDPPLLHYAEWQDVIFWRLSTVGH